MGDDTACRQVEFDLTHERAPADGDPAAYTVEAIGEPAPNDDRLEPPLQSVSDVRHYSAVQERGPALDALTTAITYGPDDQVDPQRTRIAYFGGERWNDLGGQVEGDATQGVVTTPVDEPVPGDAQATGQGAGGSGTAGAGQGGQGGTTAAPSGSFTAPPPSLDPPSLFALAQGPGDDTVRLAGETRIQTAVEISQDLYPSDAPAAGAPETGTAVPETGTAGTETATAGAVVLARGDDPTGYADALSGTPFASEVDAPVLITFPDELHPDTEAELQRVLPAGQTVFLVGGEVALSAEVQQRVESLGYATERIAGPTRFETAVEVARRLESPDPLLIATGFDFPDALVAGTAAANVDGAVLLTADGERPPGHGRVPRRAAGRGRVHRRRRGRLRVPGGAAAGRRDPHRDRRRGRPGAVRLAARRGPRPARPVPRRADRWPARLGVRRPDAADAGRHARRRDT